MKAETSDPKPGFKPVSLTLTFESQLELDVFYQTFNYSPITETQCKLIGIEPYSKETIDSVIRDALKLNFNDGDIHNWKQHLKKT